MKPTPEIIKKQQMHKGVLLYICYNGYSGTKYYLPTDDELKTVLSATNEILLIPIVTYNRYTDSDGNVKQVITKETIENMTPDMVGDPNRFEIIKSEYFATAEARITANYHVQDYINDSVALANRLVAIKPDVRLWFSVPSSECLHALTHLFADCWISLVHNLKATLSPEIWENNVQGIYYANEDIVTAGYTKFDPSVPEQNFNNPIVESMRRVSDVVHAYGKNMLWIPYYHEAASSSKNLGYVVNLTDIFDTVIIQPSFFFNSARVDEIGIIRECMKQQAVVDINGNIIGGEKTSNANIGFEMEIDWQYFNDPAYVERYQAYEKGFGEYLDKCPTAYYAGSPDTMLKLADLIKNFFDTNK